MIRYYDGPNPNIGPRWGAAVQRAYDRGLRH